MNQASLPSGIHLAETSGVHACRVRKLARTRLAIELNPFIPVLPTDRQLVFLADDRLEVLYGGAAGGGKSVALLMAALQHVEQAGYHAVLFRRTMTMLQEPGALIGLSKEWLNGKAQWSESKSRWHFPSGASLSFRFLDKADDHLTYQGAAYHFLGFDEATQFRSQHYTYLFSRLRRDVKHAFPLRIRGATNPGGPSHGFFKARFFHQPDPNRGFVSAKLEDNPHLDAATYETQLDQLNPVDFQRLRLGSWQDDTPRIFKPEWLMQVATYELPQPDFVILVGDTAQKTGVRNDFSCFFCFGFSRHAHKAWPIARLYGKYEYPDLVAAFRAFYAEIKGLRVRIKSVHIEDKTSGTALIQDLRRASGMPIVPIRRDRRSKVERAQDVVGHLIAGNMVFPHDQPFAHSLREELLAFPDAEHDDQVDVIVDALDILFNQPALNANGSARSEPAEKHLPLNPNIHKPRIRSGRMLGL